MSNIVPDSINTKYLGVEESSSKYLGASWVTNKCRQERINGLLVSFRPTVSSVEISEVLIMSILTANL